jgi:hypothetical protein
LRNGSADPRKWVDDLEHWMLNNNLTVNGQDPEDLDLPRDVGVRIDDLAIEKRFMDGTLGVTVRLWEGESELQTAGYDSWAVWQVILRPAGRGWRIENAVRLALKGDDDRSAYGPETDPSPYSNFEPELGGLEPLF